MSDDKGKCPGDCPTPDEKRLPQPKTTPVQKVFDAAAGAWKKATTVITTKQGAAQDSRSMADRAAQVKELKSELKSEY